MEFHEELVNADVVILMEHHEKSELWESSHQRSFVGHIRGSGENLNSANEANGWCESEQRTLKVSELV